MGGPKAGFSPISTMLVAGIESARCFDGTTDVICDRVN